MLAATTSARLPPSRISERWPSWRKPMVGTSASRLPCRRSSAQRAMMARGSGMVSMAMAALALDRHAVHRAGLLLALGVGLHHPHRAGPEALLLGGEGLGAHLLQVLAHRLGDHPVEVGVALDELGRE